MLALLGLLHLQHAGFPCGRLHGLRRHPLCDEEQPVHPKHTDKANSLLFSREYLCVDKTGTLTTDHVTLLKHLNPQLRSSDTLLDLAYINSSMQASHTSLLQTDLGMAALREARPWKRVLDVCPARTCRKHAAADRISLGCCCSLQCMPTCCLVSLTPTTRLPAFRVRAAPYKLLLFQLCATNAHILSYVSERSR